MGVFLYFSFGSNLLRQRIRINNPSAAYRGIAKLQGYKFHFAWPVDLKVKPEECRWKGCAATITEDSISHVWGTLWELNDTERPSLDLQEKGYYPLEVEITDDKGNNQLCLTYRMSGEYDQNRTCPSPQYKDVVLRGARQSQLPAEYIQFLESFPDNGCTERVEIYEQVLGLLK